MEEFKQTIIDVHGKPGSAWLENLEGLIRTCAQHWGLTILGPMPGLSYNYVTRVLLADGSRAVLKLGVPNPELLSELAALRIFDGQAAVRLLDCDQQLGALLLEELLPGIPLSALEDDEQATRMAAAVMQALWRPAPAEHDFPTVARWAGGLARLRLQFDGRTGPLPAELFSRAEALFADLLASQTSTSLLHGDLHHENILSAQRLPWLAIDPKGLVGEPAYEVGAFLYNPFPGLLQKPDVRRVLSRRIAILSETLGIEQERLLGYGIAQAVLSACWSIEDHITGWEHTIRVAEHLEAILREKTHP